MQAALDCAIPVVIHPVGDPVPVDVLVVLDAVDLVKTHVLVDVAGHVQNPAQMIARIPVVPSAKSLVLMTAMEIAMDALTRATDALVRVMDVHLVLEVVSENVTDAGYSGNDAKRYIEWIIIYF